MADPFVPYTPPTQPAAQTDPFQPYTPPQQRQEQTAAPPSADAARGEIARSFLPWGAGAVLSPEWVGRQERNVVDWYKRLGERNAEDFKQTTGPQGLFAGHTDKDVKRAFDPKNPEYQRALDLAGGLAAGEAGPGDIAQAVPRAGVRPIPPTAPRLPPRRPPRTPQPTADPIHVEGPLSHPAAISDPERFAAQLHALTGNTHADKIDMMHMLDAVPPGVRPETWEKLYHYEENPTGIQLTPEEQHLYDTHVKPITDEADRLARELEGFGYQVPEGAARPAGSETYTPRYRTGTRSFGEVLRQWQAGIEARFGGAAGRTMRKTVNAQKARRFWKAVNPKTGEETIVHIGTDGSVTGFDGSPRPTDFGTFPRGQSVTAGAQVRSTQPGFSTGAGEMWRLEPATTLEIEQVAHRVQYSKNVMANRLDNLSKLRSAVRNARFINEMKNSNRWPDVAIPAESGVTPRTDDGRAWRIPHMLQFRQYMMDPRLADAIDEFAGNMGNLEGLDQFFLQVGHVMNNIMFLNPLPHISNVFNHMMVGRGVAGNVAQLPSTVRNLARAAREVYNAGPLYRRMLRSGLSLPYARYLSEDLHNFLITRLGRTAIQDPAVMDRWAQAMGYQDGKAMMLRWGKAPSRFLWWASDVMTMSRTLQLMENGSLLRGPRNIEEAIEETHAAMPSYRLPGTIVTRGEGGRIMRQAFANPAWGRFGRYQFNRLQIYMNDLRDAFGRWGEADIRQRAEAWDRLSMLGFYTFVVYPFVFDQAWRVITGNPHAEAIRSGASSVPKAIQESVQGKRTIGDVLTSVYTAGVPVQLPFELYVGRYGWSGEPIWRDADVRAQRWGMLFNDTVRYLGNQFSTIGQLVSAQGSGTWGQTLLRAAGVKSPTSDQLETQEYYRDKARNEAEKRAMRKGYE